MKADVKTLSIASVITISIIGYVVYTYKPKTEKDQK